MILQSVRALSLRFFLQTIGMVRYKILRLEVEKHHFSLIIGPHVNKYMFKHVSGPIFSKTALKFQGLKYSNILYLYGIKIGRACFCQGACETCSSPMEMKI
jgi:hypothetical protein